LELVAVAFNPLILNMRELLERSIGPAVRIEFALADDLAIARADPNQMQAALLNLAINARDAMPDGGVVRIETTNVTLPASDGVEAGSYVEVAVTDTGTGMPESVRERVFEPFFTTKESGRGTGLGLAQVYGFVRQCGGDVGLESVVGAGTTFRLRFPRA
ncbi:MAG: hypothetical protein J0H99_03170, partial [Rhodospirillales bacterium]|nr:hypothetical protein [Rhodospirillales bacterium]